MLAAVDCRDVYEFLQLDRNATPEHLREAAKKEKERIHNKGMRGPVWDNRKALADICITLFKSDASKREYDRTLEASVDAQRTDDRRERPSERFHEFDAAKALLETGWGLVSRDDVEGAVVMAKDLTGDHPEYTRFRTTIARLFLTQERYVEAIEFLGWCVRQEPDNAKYRVLLGTACARAGTATWKLSEGSLYATSADQVAEAEKLLTFARQWADSVAGNEGDLDRAIADLEGHIETAKQRTWNGYTLAVIAAFIFGMNALNDPFMVEFGAIQLTSMVVYILSAWDPQWKVNKAALEEQKREATIQEYSLDGWTRVRSNRPERSIAYLAKIFFTFVFLPFVAAWKFCWNFWPTYRNSPSRQRIAAVTIVGSALFLWWMWPADDAGDGPGPPVDPEPVTVDATGDASDQGQADGGGPVNPSGDVEEMAVVSGAEGAGDGNSASTQAAEADLHLDRSARRRIQMGLTVAGFSPGAPDGVFGAGTRRAIREWQATRGGFATGYLDADEAGELMALGASSSAEPEPRNAGSPARASGRRTAGSPAEGEARLVVQAAPESQIEIDGAEVGATNQAGILVVTGVQAGRHIVVASKEGYETVNRRVEVVSGRSDVLELRMVPRPATLSVTANVPDAMVRIAGVGEFRLPVTSRRIEPGSYRLTVSKPLFVEAEDNVEVRAGQSATLDFVLRPRPVDELLREVHNLFDARRYRDVVRRARTVMELHPQAGGPYLLAGRALYELRNFDDSAAFLRQAIDLGQEVKLPAKHRHAGLGLLESFCDGVLSLTKDEVVFRSFSGQDHSFRVAPQSVLELRPQAGRSGRVVRIDSRIAVLEEGRERTRNFDFLHKDTIRATTREGTVLSCRGCDASMNVQAALLQHLRRSAM